LSISERAHRLMSKGQRHWRAGKLDAARKAFGQALKMHPNNLQIMSQQATLELDSQNACRAVPILRKMTAMRPDDVDMSLRLVEALEDSADVGGALDVVTAIIQHHPDHAEALNTLGNVLQGRQDYEGALEAYNKALKLRGDAAPIWANAGNILDELERHDEAVEHYSTALKLRPLDAPTHYYRARALTAIGQPKEAMADVEKTLSIDPVDQKALALQGVLFAMLGQHEEAQRLFDYDRFIKTFRPEPPKGFRTIEEFNAAVIAHIRNRTGLEYNPPGASTRGGWHSGNLLADKPRLIESLRAMLQQIFETYVSELPAGTDHPVLRQSYSKLHLVAQAQILESQGFLLSHIHPGGWISSAYYLAIPDEVSNSDNENAGWLEFGRPTADIKTDVKLETRCIKPQPGMVALFPSYFFHGTRPFDCDFPCISMGVYLIVAG